MVRVQAEVLYCRAEEKVIKGQHFTAFWSKIQPGIFGLSGMRVSLGLKLEKYGVEESDDNFLLEKQEDVVATNKI